SPAFFETIYLANINSVTFVVGRGNNGYNDELYPATIPMNDWIISVGASEVDGNLKTYANIADTSTGDSPSSFGRKMDLIAPGSSRLVVTLANKKDTLQKFFNTSCATPHVSGTAALMLIDNLFTAPNGDKTPKI